MRQLHLFAGQPTEPIRKTKANNKNPFNTKWLKAYVDALYNNRAVSIVPNIRRY